MRYYRGIIITYLVLLALSILFLIGKVITPVDPSEFNTFDQYTINMDEFFMIVFLYAIVVFEGNGRFVGTNELMYQNYPRKKVYLYKQLLFGAGFVSSFMIVMSNVFLGADILFIVKHLYLPTSFLLFIAYGNFTTKAKHVGIATLIMMLFAFGFGILNMIGSKNTYWLITWCFTIVESIVFLVYIGSVVYAYKKKVKAYNF